MEPLMESALFFARQIRTLPPRSDSVSPRPEKGGRSMAKFTPALVLAVCMTSLSACRAQEMTKPLGKWERKSGKSHVTLIVEENRLHVTFIGENPCTLHADYAMTKDGVVYGVVTSIECDDDEDAVKVI